MKIKIRNLYAVAYSVALKHCPRVGVAVGCCHKCFDKGHVRRSLYYWCRLVLGCHHQRTCHCLRQMSWQKVRHFAYFTYSHSPRHDSTTELRAGPESDQDQDQDRTGPYPSVTAETAGHVAYPFGQSRNFRCLSASIQFLFNTFCFATGNTSCTTKHKIVLSILCGLNKIKIIKTQLLSMSSSLAMCACVCVSVSKGISVLHPLNVVYFLRLFLSCLALSCLGIQFGLLVLRKWFHFVPLRRGLQ